MLRISRPHYFAKAIHESPLSSEFVGFHDATFSTKSIRHAMG